MVEFANSAYYNRGFQGLPKSRTPAGLTFLNDKQELSSPLLYLWVPHKYVHAAAFMQTF